MPRQQFSGLQESMDDQSGGISLTPPAFQLMANGSKPIQMWDQDAVNGARCLAPPVTTDKKLLEFAKAFNFEFKSVLHVFTNKAMGCGTSTSATSSGKASTPTNVSEAPDKSAANASESPASKKKGEYPGVSEMSGPEVQADVLGSLFTATQQEKILKFTKDKLIPDRLFNGDDIGNTTAQQRLLMSAHILSVGKYQQGSMVEKVHARMCWHWVHITHDYAGAAVSGQWSSLNNGVMGSTDHTGKIIFNIGKYESIHDGKFKGASKLPASEGGGYGPVPVGSKHKVTVEADQSRIANLPPQEEWEAEQKRLDEEYAKKNPGKKRKRGTNPYNETAGRKQGMSYDDLAKLEPGDWLYYYNANATNIGCHSVIFSHWAGDMKKTPTGIRYRRAIFFSQPNPESGGHEHEALLGEGFYKTPLVEVPVNEKEPDGEKEWKSPPGAITVFPVPYVTRVSKDSRPATTVEELLDSQSETAAAAEKENKKYIAQFETKSKFKLNEESMIESFREECSKIVDYLNPRLTDGQKKMLAEAYKSVDPITVIRITEKLRALKTNIELLKIGEDKIASTDLATRHKEYETAKKALEQQISDAMFSNTLNSGVRSVLAADRDASDIKVQKKRLATAKAELAKLKKSKASKIEIMFKEAQIGLLSDHIKELSDPVKAKEAAANIATRKKEIAALDKKTQANEAKIRTSKQAIEDLTTPYATAHPGDWGGKANSSFKTTGLLKNVISFVEMEKFKGDPIAAAPGKAAKPTKKGKK